MRRSWVARWFASLFAVWFAVSLAEPAMLHACRMHGMHTAGAASMAPVHAAHHAHGALHGAVPDSQRTSHPASHCTCLGSCTASSAGAVLPAPAESLRASAAFVAAAPIHAVVARAITSAPFVLPYANGPPAHAQLA